MEKMRFSWATLGCGAIACEMAEAMARLDGGFHGAAARNSERVRAFAAKYGIEKVYEKPEQLFRDPDVDIVYISTPHNTHAPYILRALEAGRHVLAEKSITLNSGELSLAASLAAKKQLVLAEAMTLYHMPLFKKLAERVRSGALGALRLAQLNFGSYKPYDEKSRFFNKNLAGGALLDIGIYALSCARWFMSAKPEELLSTVRFAPTGVDEQSSILLKNRAEEMAAVTLSLHAKQPKRATIVFDKGYMEIFDYPRADKAAVVWTADGRREEITAGSAGDALCYEILDMEAAAAGETDAMHLDYTSDVMEIMTRLRKSWGLKYPEEA